MTDIQTFTESLYGDSYLEHHGILGMKWGVRRTPEQLGYKNPKRKSKRQIRKENREAVRKAAKERAEKLAQANRDRILREIHEYEKKVGGDFAKKFLENYDDIEMWDLYSPEELKYW